MKRYQGEDIEFRLIYKKGEDTTIEDWSGFQEIIAIFYTDGCYVIKFTSKSNPDSGFNGLTLVDSNTYSGNIKNEDSKKLAKGLVTIEIKGILIGDEVCISRAISGIEIGKNIIKNI